MVALMVDSAAKVDALHRKALQLGGTDEEAPGPRGEGFYAGYFRDLDGNKLNFFCAGKWTRAVCPRGRLKAHIHGQNFDRLFATRAIPLVSTSA